MKAEKKISVVVVEPGKEAYVKEISHSLEAMQNIVGGYIEAIYPFDDRVALVCNEEGKINCLPPSRIIYYDRDKKFVDIICGTFFICGLTKDSFGTLSPRLAEKYRKAFNSQHVCVWEYNNQTLQAQQV